MYQLPNHPPAMTDIEPLESDSLGLPLVARLSGGDVGYYQRRVDDCFRAAVATVLQVPIDEVPDPDLDAQIRDGVSPADLNAAAWEQLENWADQRGLRVGVTDKVPPGRDRWLGVSPGLGDFNDHLLVMSGGEAVFDPAARLPVPAGRRRAPARILTHAITFDPKEE